MDYVTAVAADMEAKSSAAFKIATSGDPDKVRAMLNIWFTPDFKPKFVSDATPQIGGLDDVQLLGPSTMQASVPIRMFDIETGNLVERPDIGVQGQYGVLSHSWKGREVTFSYVEEAREEAKKAGHDTSARPHDVQLIKEKCKRDVEDQEATIKALAEGILHELGLSDTCDVVGELLSRRIKVKEAKRGKAWAVKEHEDAVAHLQYSKMEDEVFQALLKNMGLKEKGEKKKVDGGKGGVADSKGSPGDQIASSEAKTGEDLTQRVEDDREKRRIAEQMLDNVANDVAFFHKHSRVVEAVDEMECLLEQWKSSIKIEQSIKQARQVFDEKSFPIREKRYLWLDTCCINKAIGSELTESLALMGDWYANAEFCLVHLDTRGTVEERIQEWGRFKQSPDGIPPKPNITCFRHIHQSEPKWATRGWTLQEAVLSKTTFYVNSSWKRLGRPVESIGPYYYLCPYIDLYIGRGKNNTPVTLKNLKNLTKLKTLKKILGDGEEKFSYLNAGKFIESAYVESSDTNGGGTEDDDVDDLDTIGNDLHGDGLHCDDGLDIDHRDHAEERKRENRERRAIRVAQLLIVVLESLGVQIPTDVDKETAIPRITQAVHVAAESLTAKETSGDAQARLGIATEKLLNSIRDEVLDEPVQTTEEHTKPKPEEIMRDLINLLLRCLVRVARGLIRADREYIAGFNKLRDLKSWMDGTVRAKFPAHKIMSLACERECTVPTDRAYSLMGVLGVGFPTFPAEGLTKAVSRLLDEIIISSNDVSVFNWSGKHLGSPIRGRSLYPSTIEAFKFQRDEARHTEKNQILAEMLQLQRYETMGVFMNITGTLRDTITFVRDRKQKNIPIEWLQEIIRVVKAAKFPVLATHFDNIGKILVFIQKNFKSKIPETSEKDTQDSSGGGGTGGAGSGYFRLGMLSPWVSSPTPSEDKTLQSQEASENDAENSAKSKKPEKAESGSFQFGIRSSLISTVLPSDSKMSRPMFSTKKSETESPSTTPQPPKRGMGGFSSLGKGFAKKDSGSSSKSPSEVAEAELASPPPASSPPPPAGSPPPTTSPPPTVSPSATFSSAETLTNETQDADQQALRKRLDKPVLDYLRSIEPPEGQSESAPTSALELPPELMEVLSSIAKAEFVKSSSKEGMETMISPNPIIVNNSGIEGIFDIQRVIITMLQPEKLRRRIDNAVSPQQKITGWCTISTGFALIMVSFSCEKHSLEKQLDVSTAIEHKVLEEKHEDSDKIRLRRRMTGQSGSKASGPKSLESEVSEPKESEPKAPEETVLAQLQKKMTGGYASKVMEGLRMTGSDDDGATEEAKKVSRMIQFVQESNLDAIAGEWVLARFSGVPGAKWFLCHLELGSSHDYYGHRISSDEIDFHDASPEMGLLEHWERYMMRKKSKLCGVLGAFLESRDFGILNKDLTEFSPAAGTANDVESEEELTLAEKGVLAVAKVGSAALEKLFEMKAEHLDKTMSASVLKGTPVHLQAALESLNDNKNLLPSMFHSAKVHMF